MPVQVARRRANSRRGSRLGRREKRGRTVNFNGELAGDYDDFSSSHVINSRKDTSNQRTKIDHSIANTRNENYGDADSRKVLLIAQCLVCRNEHLKTSINSGPEQHAIFQAEPVLSANGRHFVAQQLFRKGDRKRFVNENFQRRRLPLWPTPMLPPLAPGLQKEIVQETLQESLPP